MLSRINYSDKMNLTVTILIQRKYNDIIIGHFYEKKKKIYEIIIDELYILYYITGQKRLHSSVFT